MEWLEGETVGGRVLRAPELEAIRPKLAFQCGEILGRIHSIDPVATGLDQRLRKVSTERFIHEGWIDAPAVPGKRPGAFCAYTVPAHHPYVMLNWTGQRRDVLTLAQQMLNAKPKIYPVVDASNKVLGVISRRHILNMLDQKLAELSKKAG